jgi:hypothetical protein
VNEKARRERAWRDLNDARYVLEHHEDDTLGPRCFTAEIQNEPFPYQGFGITKHIKPYNGEVRPHTWLQDYSMAIDIAKGNTYIACKYPPIMLEGSARVWLNSLPRNSIASWADMRNAFDHNFEGTYKRSYMTDDLASCKMKEGETSRDFLA